MITTPIPSRRVLVLALALASSPGHRSTAADDADAPKPVKHLIDTHIHLYDTTRGVPITWPPKDDAVLYRPHLPAEFSKLAKADGVTGVVVVEASHILEDNQWVLDLVKGDPFYIGLVGNVDVNRADFEEQIVRLKKDPRFVGVRARCPEPIDFTSERVLANLAVLARHDLTLDYLTNGGGVAGVDIIERVARALPDLRIMVNHCLGYNFDGKAPAPEWGTAIQRLAAHPKVWCKISGLDQRSVIQPAPRDLEHYRAFLEMLWTGFGPERLIYGSNWPVTKHAGTYESCHRLVDRFISAKGQEAREQYYWKNAATAYRLPLE